MKKYLLPSFGLIFSLFLLLSPKISFAMSKIVIDEIRVSSQVSTYDEYIKISNYSDSDFSLKDYKLKKKTKSTNPDLVIFPASSFIPAQGSIVVAYSKTGTFVSEEADFTYSNTSLASNFSIYLQRNNEPFLDSVGLLEVEPSELVYYYFETTPIKNLSVGQVYSRRNGIDTDNNLNDFALKAASQLIDANADKLIISELYPNPKTGESEWFELFNPTSLKINLAGLKVCDVLGSTHCYYLDKNDSIEANSYKTYSQEVTKITLNDSGDYLELRDGEDNVIFGTDNYEGADDGMSFSLFGSNWDWTSQSTKGLENIFQDIIEVEEKVANVTAPKKVSSKKKTTVAVIADEEADSSNQGAVQVSTDVKAAETKAPLGVKAKTFISNNLVGWGLVALAILGAVIYTILEFKEYIYDFYDKLRGRDR